jgi:hypothetical protein
MHTARSGEALTRLRAKTNRELGILVRRELDRSLILAGQNNYRDAELGYATAKTWLAVSELTGEERVSLENKLDEVRAALGQPEMALAAGVSRFTSDSSPALPLPARFHRESVY